MPFSRTLAVTILTATCVVGLAIFVHEPWEKLTGLLDYSKTPTPFLFKSLKNAGDEEIASFMSGTPTPDHFRPADAPDSNFPGKLWGTDPKAAALAFADANRMPAHRKDFTLSIDGNPAIKAPDAGWIVLDSGSSICYSNTQGLTVLRFGTDQPFLFCAGSNLNGAVGYNPFTDRYSHELRLIPLTPDEARFLAHTSFWLEHLQSRRNDTKRGSAEMKSTGDGFVTLGWFVDKHPPRQISETLWSDFSIASRWNGENEKEASLNLTNHLLTEALPVHLGKRWGSRPPLTHATFSLSINERMKPRVDDAAREQLTDITLSAIARHDADPWPAAALVALADCAGDAGLPKTLPALEELAAHLPPPTVDETELALLQEKFHSSYESPKDSEGRKQWQRYEFLRDQLEHDFPTQLRRPLTQAIRQLRALDHPDQLLEMAKGDATGAIWALQQLYPDQPEAHAEALIARFRSGNPRQRALIFDTLAAARPPAARSLRDTLSENEQAELIIVITGFEITDSPASAQARIPALLEIVRNPDKSHNENTRGQAIDLLAKLPLDPPQQATFERQLLDEILSSTREPNTISHAVAAVVKLPKSDRYWDALFAIASTTPYPDDFDSLRKGLATLAVANPEPRIVQLAEFLRPRFARHQGVIHDLCMTALALDLRPLAPDIARFATSGPQVPDGEYCPNHSGNVDSPCYHRYHTARHVTALWLEPDTDTRARMWTALLLKSPYEFVGVKTIPSKLRDRCRSSMTAASPDIRSRLVAQARSSPGLPDELSAWLAAFP